MFYTFLKLKEIKLAQEKKKMQTADKYQEIYKGFINKYFSDLLTFVLHVKILSLNVEHVFLHEH